MTAVAAFRCPPPPLVFVPCLVLSIAAALCRSVGCFAAVVACYIMSFVVWCAVS